MTENRGHCKHGEFDLLNGCNQCIEERRVSELAEQLKDKLSNGKEQESKPIIVKVQYYSETSGEVNGREYTYYSIDRLNVGDMVIVPVRDTIGKAIVSSIDVPEAEIASFKDKVKIIPSSSIIPKKVEPQLQELEDGLNSEGLTLKHRFTAPEPLSEEARQIITGGRDGMIANATAIVNVKPSVDGDVVKLYGEIEKVKEYAVARVITSLEDVKAATEDLSMIAKLKKAVEEKRQEYVKPLNDHVKAVNDYFKLLTEPIREADSITRQKVLDFRAKEERKRQEQERINQLRMEAAQKEMELKGELTESVNLVEVQPESPERYRTDVGMASKMTVRKWQVEDITKVPPEYLMVDAGKITKLVKAGIGYISGIKIYYEDTLRISAFTGKDIKEE